MKKTRRNDLILIGVLALTAAGLYLGMRFYQEKTTKNGIAVVTIRGEIVGRFPLDQDTVQQFDLGEGEYNILEITEGKAQMTGASCPDQICVHHPRIEKNKETIVCLPHALTVQIENGEEAEIDGSTH